MHYANRVKALEPLPGGWRVSTRRGELLARHVVANVLPQGLVRLLGPTSERLPARVAQLAGRVAEGWGAVMLYLVVRAPEGASLSAHHLELMQDAAAPFIEGNHLFASLSGEADTGRAPPGHRTLTASTHVAYRRERSHVEGEGWSGGAEKGRCRGQQGHAPRRDTGRCNPLGHTPTLAALA